MMGCGGGDGKEIASTEGDGREGVASRRGRAGSGRGAQMYIPRGAALGAGGAAGARDRAHGCRVWPCVGACWADSPPGDLDAFGAGGLLGAPAPARLLLAERPPRDPRSPSASHERPSGSTTPRAAARARQASEFATPRAPIECQPARPAFALAQNPHPALAPISVNFVSVYSPSARPRLAVVFLPPRRGPPSWLEFETPRPSQQ